MILVLNSFIFVKRAIILGKCKGFYEKKISNSLKDFSLKRIKFSIKLCKTHRINDNVLSIYYIKNEINALSTLEDISF